MLFTFNLEFKDEKNQLELNPQADKDEKDTEKIHRIFRILFYTRNY